MLSSRKKKLDYQARFQNRGFKNRLDAQRNYKRNQKKLPQTDWGVFLKKIGLGSWTSRILTSGLLVLIIYLAYIPNFLFIKTITISGLDQTSQNYLKSTTERFLQKTLPWPQKNLFFLSKNQLSAYLQKNDQEILQINNIKKHYPNTLDIQVTARVNTYLLANTIGEYYALGQDGVATGQVTPDASGTLPSGLLLIKLDSDTEISQNQSPFSPNHFNFLQNLLIKFANQAHSKINNITINNLNDPYLVVLTDAGYAVKFDISSDVDKTLSRLNTLLGQIQPGDLKNIKYIDMRFGDRAYTCIINSDCAKELLLAAPTSTIPTLITH